MSKFTEQLGKINISNPNDFASDGQVWIAYYPAEHGRGSRCARYVVHRKGYWTDPNAHWLDNGDKTFSCFCREDKVERLQEARDWASVKYKIKKWDRTPFGDWMDAKFIERRVAELKRMLSEEAEKA